MVARGGSGAQCASLTHYVPRRHPSFARLTSMHGKKLSFTQKSKALSI